MKRSNLLYLTFSALAIFGASERASASPIVYNLTFTGGSITPTGSFSYDSSLSTNPFSNFTATAAGGLYDFTSAANNFSGNANTGACKSAQTAAGFFHAITTAGCQNLWQLNPGFFALDVCSVSGNPCGDGNATVNQAGTPPVTVGLYTAAPASATPEPGTVYLVGLAALALAAGRARRRSPVPAR